MNNFRPSGFSIMPLVVKNLLIVNGLCFLANVALEYRFNISLNGMFGIYNIESSWFKPYQIFTHLFMHADLGHILLNMFSLWMFGSALENYWGPKRFFIFYFVTGFGAAFIHTLINYIEFASLKDSIPLESLDLIKHEGREILMKGMNYTDANIGKMNLLLNVPTVGASGAVFGLLLGYGMLFPNTMLIGFPIFIPLKAKYVVIIYGLIELFSGIRNNPADNVAHFAHLGGMLFGFFLIKYWNKNRRDTFY
jgi:membrane associated rhomboid family serine protease